MLSETEYPAGVRPVPQRRIREKLDDCMSRRDYAGVERLLLYWREEARQGRDRRGLLMILNEMVGHYRKTGEREKAFDVVADALKLLEDMDFGDTLSAGTTWVNAGTALSAFGEPEKALPLFEKARAVYESGSAAEPRLLGGLYNNMALACVALRRWEEAEALYALAMAQMGRVTHGALEQAITCLNLADLAAARDGMEAAEGRIFDLLEQASALLNDPSLPRDGYYAFVCEKCAPAFDHYGWFADAENLKREARRIYEGT